MGKMRRVLFFLARFSLRIAFLGLFALFVASQTVAGVAMKLGSFFASIGIETVTSVLEAREQKASKALEKTRSENLDLVARNQELAQKFEVSDKDRRVLQTELEAVNAENRNLKGKLVTAVATNEVKAAEIASLQSRLRGEIDWRGRKALPEEVVLDVTRAVKTRTMNVAVSNSTSVFGEGIPVYGVGIIIATLGYELKTACDTMKDMDELQRALDPDAINIADTEKVCGLEVPTREEVWAAIKASPSVAWDAAVTAYGDALEAVPSWDETKTASADFLDWTKSSLLETGAKIADISVNAYIWLGETGSSAIDGVSSVSSDLSDKAKKAWYRGCLVFCD